MTIDSIVLFNIGSYEGQTIFDMRARDGRNIVLIGGKNGAGKTTLFTAMRVCLYGFVSMGYKNYNSYYTRAITKLINNAAKINRPAKAYVRMSITLNNPQGVDAYDLHRCWILSDSLSETFEVYKNGRILDPESQADFEKYLTSIIPPELFNLYFFDGEKIADFFMTEGSDARIRNAFLILCGYDTFDIMRKNFKRISTGKSTETPSLREYIDAKDRLSEESRIYKELEDKLNTCITDTDLCEAAIAASEKEYRNKGGITQEEWNEKFYILKDEERKREAWNNILRKWANDTIPFLILRPQLEALKKQIEGERSEEKIRNFCEMIDRPDISAILGDKLSEIKTVISKEYGESGEPILDYSFEQSSLVLSHLNRILSFEKEKIPKYKWAIKHSLKITAETRKELDSANVSNVQEFMKTQAKLFEEKSDLLVQRLEIEQRINEQKDVVASAETDLEQIQARLSDELKKASISDISARSILMLDKLQTVLYRRQIERVEEFFRTEIRTLMRKKQFIDDIRIDDSFRVHLYRNESFSCDQLNELMANKSEGNVVSLLGSAAVDRLIQIAEVTTFDNMVWNCRLGLMPDNVTIPVEIDKESLSNGEKQIFIMALYHSLVMLGKHEIPFVIDTPFARIDTEHRQNISKYFFSKLNGQVFILSTNEEVNESHVQIMRDRIAATYLLENEDNKRTIVKENRYFEV